MRHSDGGASFDGGWCIAPWQRPRPSLHEREQSGRRSEKRQGPPASADCHADAKAMNSPTRIVCEVERPFTPLPRGPTTRRVYRHPTKPIHKAHGVGSLLRSSTPCMKHVFFSASHLYLDIHAGYPCGIGGSTPNPYGGVLAPGCRSLSTPSSRRACLGAAFSAVV